jgi:hypothetical protein
MKPLGMPDDIFTLREPEEVVSALGEAGFRDVCVERPRPETAWNIIVAIR